MTRTRLLLIFGLLALAAGPTLHGVRIALGDPDTPTYLPFLSGAGALLLVAHAARRRTRGAILGAAAAGLVALGLGLYPLALRAPSYDGPARVGQPLSPFTARPADGTAFDLERLRAGGPAVMVFFRHW